MPDTVDPDLPRGVALAWGIAANPQRGPKREMSVERIVEAAIDIADAEGLGAVSMSAVAARLGYTPMSLYRYVSAKDDLILLMQEDATGLPSEATRHGAWRERLTALHDEMLQGFLRHPWVLEIPITGAPLTPNSAAWMDAGLDALSDTALPHTDRLAVTLMVTGQARWAGTIAAGYARRAKAGDVEITAQEDAAFRMLITAEAFPRLREAIDAGVFLDESDPFSFALGMSLDGVAAYIERAADGKTAPARPWAELEDADLAGDKRYRAASKTVREAEKALRAARKQQREVARAARERLAAHAGE